MEFLEGETLSERLTKGPLSLSHEQGTILGTFQYMAPEQLEGAEADARTDIFAFGTVLYEMLSGKKAFEGKSRASLVAAILEHDPPSLTMLQPMTPGALDRLVKVCLAKDRDQRWQSAHDIAVQLHSISQTAPAAAAMPHRRALILVLLAAVAAAAALVTWMIASFRLGNDPRAGPLARFTVAPPPATRFNPVYGLALSPDGRRLAFVTEAAHGHRRLWTRELDSLTPRPLHETDGANLPFWSPDSRYLGFFNGTHLVKIEAGGGPPQALCDAPLGQGGAWSTHGTIVFSRKLDGPLYAVSADGGNPRPVTTLSPSRQERSH